MSTNASIVSPLLVPWLGGRSAPRPSDGMAYLDPRRLADAAFFDLARTLDRVGWAAPLSRERPSWVFYDCALMPGAFFGLALEAAHLPDVTRAELGVPNGYLGLAPITMLALIPTLDGYDLVQSLAAIDLPDQSADALAVTTLIDGLRALGVRTLTAALPWRSHMLSRFLAVGALRLRTAWTPAHDEVRTVTFSVTVTQDSADVTGGHAFRIDPDDDATLTALQRDLERGAAMSIVGLEDGALSLVRHP